MARITGIDAEIFPLNLGGNALGWTTDADGSFAVLDAFAAAGGNFIDTADSYSQWAPGNAGGESETIIGAWLAARGNRDEVVVATKVGGLATRKGLAPATIRAAADDSLRRLGVDVIDLYYAHHDDIAQPIGDIARAFDALVRAGKVKAVGMSNLSPERQQEWLDAAASAGLAAPVAMQPHYNLVHRREYEVDYGPLAARHSLAVMPYYALASGFLTGKYRTPADKASSARGEGAGRYLTPDGLAVLAVLGDVADELGVAPASVALAWLLAKGVTAPIASARVPGQLAPLFAGVELTLDAEQVERLDAASRPFA